VPLFERLPPLYPRGPWLGFELYCLDPSWPSTTPCASPAGTLRFRFSLIRSAFAVRERLGDPRDLPYFCGCAFRACCRPCSGGPPRLPIVLTRRFQASSNYHGVATHKTVSASNIRRVIRFRSCIVLVMLRPARLPSPPDWLRRDEATCTSPRPLRYIVTPAFNAARYRATLGVRLDGRTGNLPSSGLSPDKSQQLVRLHDRKNKLPDALRRFLGRVPVRSHMGRSVNFEVSASARLNCNRKCQRRIRLFGTPPPSQRQA